MTSLFGRIVGVRYVEDLFTEAVARLFERRPDICLGWLREIGAISAFDDDHPPPIRVSTQKSFVALEGHDRDSRPDILVKIHRVSDDEDAETYTELVMIESKLGSWEGPEQLKRYAEHLEKLPGEKKTLIYITCAYDPKKEKEILVNTANVIFQQFRWHDFYKFLQNCEKDALVEEAMLFMEERGMSRSHRLSTTDLIALSGMRRAIEILDETMDDEVKGKLESLMGNKVQNRRNWFRTSIRQEGGYFISASTMGEKQLHCSFGYYFNGADNYPIASVGFWMDHDTAAQFGLSSLIRQISAREGWMTYGPNEPEAWPEVWNELNLATIANKEDHIFAIKRFFIESIRELREELTEFKKENPDLPWNGGN